MTDTDSIPMPTVYVETTIISYLTARPSRDVVVLGNQQLTRQWWEEQRSRYRLVLSPVVLQEVGQGDTQAAGERLASLEGMELLEPEVPIEDLSVRVQQALDIPSRAKADAVHLAYAVYYEVDYLLTWNCAHLAGARSLRRLADFVRTEGLWLPVICTPRELVEPSTEE
ncbi:MAG: type II toxin-antitoxin system VapC family toxin [Phycisphaerales bacterium]|nr:type II toxin-antitoxin system VapC family toxin [Phycisphaerales bacterium]